MLLARSRAWLIGAALVLVCAITAAAVGSTWWSRQQRERVARAITGGDPTRAPEVMRRYGCAACHTVPGIAGADGQVGPPLSGLTHRVFIGGVSGNSPDNLVQWIVTPQKFSPRSAMPATGILEAEARDVAAYLYTQ